MRLISKITKCVALLALVLASSQNQAHAAAGQVTLLFMPAGEASISVNGTNVGLVAGPNGQVRRTVNRAISPAPGLIGRGINTMSFEYQGFTTNFSLEVPSDSPILYDLTLVLYRDQWLLSESGLVVSQGKYGAPGATTLPPDVLYQNELKALFASDSCVSVGLVDMENNTLRIDVCNEIEAQALADLLKPGGPSVAIQVFGPNGVQEMPQTLPTDLDQLQAIVEAGFSNNCFFIGTQQGFILATPVLFVETAKTALQYFGDNIGDPNANVSELPETAFIDKLVNFPRLSFYTSPDWITSCGGGK